MNLLRILKTVLPLLAPNFRFRLLNYDKLKCIVLMKQKAEKLKEYGYCHEALQGHSFIYLFFSVLMSVQDYLRFLHHFLCCCYLCNSVNGSLKRQQQAIAPTRINNGPPQFYCLQCCFIALLPPGSMSTFIRFPLGEMQEGESGCAGVYLIT